MSTNLRARFTETMLTTAPQELLLTMVYDRLARDLGEALRALDSRQFTEAHLALVHAQELVDVLDRSLDDAAWPDAVKLHSLYEFVQRRLMSANVRKDASAVADCLVVITPLREAWHEAYRQLRSTLP